MQNDTDNIIIRPLADTDSIDDLTDLLHRAYKILADMGLKFLAAHQDVSITKSRIGRGECFVAEDNGRIIGTICFYMPDAINNVSGRSATMSPPSGKWESIPIIKSGESAPG